MFRVPSLALSPPDNLTVAGSLPCWLDVDLDAVSHNVAVLRRWVGSGTQIAAVVKAQAYGVGSEQIARAALAAGASWLAVARVHEAQALRAAGIVEPILILTRTDPSEAETAVRLGLSVTVDGPELARAMGAAAARQGRPARVHVKIDSGLHRLGIAPEDALDLVRDLSAVPGLELEGIYTHFASADGLDPAFTKEQLGCFEAVVEKLEEAGYVFGLRHAANSAATLGHPASHLDMVRVGLSLYGASPTGEAPKGLELVPALSLRARVVRVFELSAGESIGYGQTWRASGRTRVAILGAGYADGISRAVSNGGRVLIQGREVPIIGRVSMDLTAVDITATPWVGVGSVATFFGTDGPHEISLHRFALQAGTIAHEALSLIGGRVARVYRSSGREPCAARLDGTVMLSDP